MPDEHLFAISVLSPWFADIANYLVSAQFPPHLSSKEKSRIMRKSASFTWIGGNLFKLGPDQILRRCVREEEVFDILLTCHDGPCGGNFAAKRTSFKILQAGYYWPTLHQDVRRYISQCDRCPLTRMGMASSSIVRIRTEPLSLHFSTAYGPSHLVLSFPLKSLCLESYSSAQSPGWNCLSLRCRSCHTFL